jgi:hypothetical protein
MALNKDGLEAGKPVSFEDMIRVKREQTQRLKDEPIRSEQPVKSEQPTEFKSRRDKPKPRGNGKSADYAISRMENQLSPEPKA